MRRLSCRAERWRLHRPLATATVTSDRVELVIVEITDDRVVGRGEAAGVHYHGETAATMLAQIEGVRAAIEAGAGRTELLKLLPPGGARNATDCALWEFEAKAQGVSVTALSGLRSDPLISVTTIGIAPPGIMAQQASELPAFPILKIKLDAQRPVDCVAAIRAARPDARLIVDANASWTIDQLHHVAPALGDLGVELIEQPCLPRDDALIDKADVPVPLCADESCHTVADLQRVLRGYSAICIKLDKTGGLTEAIELARTARDAGLDLMIGNMLGTALGMAPASLLGPWCRYVDIDGPLLLAEDRRPGLAADGALIRPLVPGVWG